MIDLREAEPLQPAHLYRDPKDRRFDFFCKEMKGVSENAYQCTDPLCRLVYNKFVFLGYYKNPNLLFPANILKDNILDKAMICKPKCAILKLSAQPGFYVCAVCGGNFMKNSEYGIISVPGDWFMQDLGVIKFLILEQQGWFRAAREYMVKNPNSEAVKNSWEKLEKLEKIFIMDILSKYRL